MLDVFFLLRCYAVCDKELLELLSLEGFHLHERRRYRVERDSVLFDDVFGLSERGDDYLFHLLIDLLGDVFGYLALYSLTEERTLGGRGECDRAHSLRHTVASYHAAREIREHLQVVRRSRRDVLENKLFRYVPTQANRDIVEEFAARLHPALFEREFERVAGRAAAADDGYFVHGVGIRQNRCDERVPRFVVGRNLFFFFVQHVAATLRTEHHFLDGADEIVLRDLLAVFARGEYRRLVHQVGEV